MSQPTPASTIRNSTCRSVGHDWKSGLDPDFRTCQRKQCWAAERFAGGAWIDETYHPSSHNKPQLATTSFSSSSVLLWNRHTYDALHTGWPPPGYDPQRERQLEQSYYKAVADERAYRAAHRGVQKGHH